MLGSMKTKNHILPAIIFTAVLLIGVTSCEQLDKLTMFKISQDFDFVVPPTEISGIPIDIASPEVETNSEKEFAAHNTAKRLIEEVTLDQLILEMQEGQENFGFVEYIEVYIKAEGLEETLVAWKYAVPDNAGQKLEMDVSKSDLSAYLKKDKISFRVRALTDRPIEQRLPIHAESTFRIDAKILGL